MPTIDNNVNLNTSQLIEQLTSALNKIDEIKQKYQNNPDAMPAATEDLASVLSALDLPNLPQPLKSLSLDTLLNAIGDEDRRANVKSAVDKINSDGERMKSEGDKKLEEIAKRIEELKAQETESIFAKIFGIIGIIFSAIGAAAAITIGAMTGNPLLVAAGVMMAISTVDSIVSMATDGKVSMMAGFTELGKAMGMSEETAKWFALGCQLAFTITAVALSFGGAAASGSAAVMDKLADAGKIANIVNKINIVAGIGSGVANIGQGATKIAQSVTAYKIAKTQITTAELDKILEQLREAIKRSQEFVEEEMQASNEILSKVKEIVEDTNETTTAILTDAPA
jgi:hypothetical protein